MGAKLKVGEGLSVIHDYKLEETLQRLLLLVPPEDLSGIEKIEVVYDSPQPKMGEVAGIYRAKAHVRGSPSIVICVGYPFEKYPRFIFKFFPFVITLLLAHLLFHEFGHHHYHRFKHGLDRKAQQRDADKYAFKLIRKHFKVYAVFLAIIFSPVIFLRKLFFVKKGDRHE